MKKLLIDTSEADSVTVSLTFGAKKITRKVPKKRDSQIVLKVVNQILKKAKCRIGELTEIEVFEGPGSFTGLRVGTAIANALGSALDIKINGKKKLVEPIYK